MWHVLLLTTIGAFVPRPALGQNANASACHDVQIFVAVGHGETFPGVQQSIAKAVCSGFSSCAYSNINYASTSTGNYCDIGTAGIETGVKDLTDYVAMCPNSKIVLSGWSQGGWLVTDIISGGGGKGQGAASGCTQKNTTALSPTTSPGNKVVAVAVYGDPRHNANQAFNVGAGSASNGVWPRPSDQLAAESLWSSKLRSYCATGDPACAGGSDWNAHSSYFGTYASTPASWIKSQISAAS